MRYHPQWRGRSGCGVHTEGERCSCLSGPGRISAIWNQEPQLLFVVAHENSLHGCRWMETKAGFYAVRTQLKTRSPREKWGYVTTVVKDDLKRKGGQLVIKRNRDALRTMLGAPTPSDTQRKKHPLQQTRGERSAPNRDVRTASMSVSQTTSGKARLCPQSTGERPGRTGERRAGH